MKNFEAMNNLVDTYITDDLFSNTEAYCSRLENDPEQPALWSHQGSAVLALSEGIKNMPAGSENEVLYSEKMVEVLSHLSKTDAAEAIEMAYNRMGASDVRPVEQEAVSSVFFSLFDEKVKNEIESHPLHLQDVLERARTMFLTSENAPEEGTARIIEQLAERSNVIQGHKKEIVSPFLNVDNNRIEDMAASMPNIDDGQYRYLQTALQLHHEGDSLSALSALYLDGQKRAIWEDVRGINDMEVLNTLGFESAAAYENTRDEIAAEGYNILLTTAVDQSNQSQYSAALATLSEICPSDIRDRCTSHSNFIDQAYEETPFKSWEGVNEFFSDLHVRASSRMDLLVNATQNSDYDTASHAFYSDDFKGAGITYGTQPNAHEIESFSKSTGLDHDKVEKMVDNVRMYTVLHGDLSQLNMPLLNLKEADARLTHLNAVSRDLGLDGYGDIPKHMLEKFDRNEPQSCSNQILKLEVFRDIRKARGPWVSGAMGMHFDSSSGALPAANCSVTSDLERINNYVESTGKDNFFECANDFLSINGLALTSGSKTIAKVFGQYADNFMDKNEGEYQWVKSEGRYANRDVVSDYNNAVMGGDCPAPLLKKASILLDKLTP